MKGICFKEPLFHATIEGRKTQTRRLVGLPDEFGGRVVGDCFSDDNPLGVIYAGGIKRPRYNVGEVIYLKEPYFDCQNCEGLYYNLYKYAGHELPYATSKWGNKLFMPKDAARHFIKITAVRAERLQDISSGDCMREGIQYPIGTAVGNANYGIAGELMKNTPREAYAALIDKINGKGTWNSNPWVWVYDYELVAH